MPKGAKQKLKLYHLSQIMIKKTDDEHFLTMPEILSFLEAEGITADRKSIYDDFDALRDLGIDIIGEQEVRNTIIMSVPSSLRLQNSSSLWMRYSLPSLSLPRNLMNSLRSLRIL